MASFNMDNYANSIASPAVKSQRGDLHGKLSVQFDEITLAQNVIAIGDKIYLSELPAYARVIDVIIESEDLGTTGVFDCGHAASADGSIVDDPNAFFSGLDCTAAVIGKMSGAAGLAGMMKRFAEPVQPYLVATTATDAADTKSMKITILYVAD